MVECLISIIIDLLHFNLSCVTKFAGIILIDLNRSVVTHSQLVLMIDVLLTKHEGRTGEYWPWLVVWCSEFHTKTSRANMIYSPVRFEQARLVGSLLYVTRALNLPTFENKKYTAYDRFHGNNPNGKIPTKNDNNVIPNVIYSREHVLQMYRGETEFSKEVYVSPAGLVVSL